jgi:hypothetical protein
MVVSVFNYESIRHIIQAQAFKRYIFNNTVINKMSIGKIRNIS